MPPCLHGVGGTCAAAAVDAGGVSTEEAPAEETKVPEAGDQCTQARASQLAAPQGWGRGAGAAQSPLLPAPLGQMQTPEGPTSAL